MSQIVMDRFLTNPTVSNMEVDDQDVKRDRSMTKKSKGIGLVS